METLQWKELVQSTDFGGRTAEEESQRLANYFVETENWRQVWNDEVDIVFAPKGGGKSAIYNMLMARQETLKQRKVFIIPAENPQGATAFQSILSELQFSESDFTRMWRLYFLSLALQRFEGELGDSQGLADLRTALASVGLADPPAKKQTLLARIKESLSRYFSPDAFETSLALDSSGTVTGVTAKFTFDEPSRAETEAGIVSIDSLYGSLDRALADGGMQAWFSLDRLDVAFTASPEMERNALRALFRVYNDMQSFESLRLKVFLRSDIWKQITHGGFREASHITRELTITWNRDNLLLLIAQRLCQSEEILRYCNVSRQEVLESSSTQERFLLQVFPNKVDAGSRKPGTFDWTLSRTRDGSSNSAPRELIHLFATTKQEQLRRIDHGRADIPTSGLFEPQSFRDALPEVSKTRLEKTLFAEYPWLVEWVTGMRGQKTLQDAVSLATTWGTDPAETAHRIERLVEVGFFEPRGAVTARGYWVPFLYRSAVDMIQGAAEGVKERLGEASPTGTPEWDDDDEADA